MGREKHKTLLLGKFGHIGLFLGLKTHFNFSFCIVMIKNNFEGSFQSLLPKIQWTHQFQGTLHQVGVGEEEEEMNSHVLAHIASALLTSTPLFLVTSSGCPPASVLPFPVPA